MIVCVQDGPSHTGSSILFDVIVVAGDVDPVVAGELAVTIVLTMVVVVVIVIGVPSTHGSSNVLILAVAPSVVLPPSS